MSQSDYPILGAEIASVRKRFQHPMLTSRVLKPPPPPITIRCSKVMSRSKVKWTAIQIQQKMAYLILGVEIASTRKRFQHPLLTSKPLTMTRNAPNRARNVSPNSARNIIATDYPILEARARKRFQHLMLTKRPTTMTPSG